MMSKKGIILAAGQATRLHPATLAFGKPFLPVADKPMIFYPLSLLLAAGIRDILVIVAPRDKQLFWSLLGDGSAFGARISYIEQSIARGIADALILGEQFIAGAPVCLALCDNFFHGDGLLEAMEAGWERASQGRATVFCHYVDNPSSYGVAKIDSTGQVTQLIEKPATLVSNWAITGLYIYDGKVSAHARTLAPSARGELEITDLNSLYLARGALDSIKLNRDFLWFDLGTYESIQKVADLVVETEKDSGQRIGCPYIAAYKAGLIDGRQLLIIAEGVGNPVYAASLRNALAAHKK